MQIFLILFYRDKHSGEYFNPFSMHSIIHALHTTENGTLTRSFHTSKMLKHYSTNCLIDTFFAFLFARSFVRSFISFHSNVVSHSLWLLIQFVCCESNNNSNDKNREAARITTSMWKRCRDWYAKCDSANFSFALHFDWKFPFNFLPLPACFFAFKI